MWLKGKQQFWGQFPRLSCFVFTWICSPHKMGNSWTLREGKGNLNYTEVCIEGSDLRPRCLNPTLLFASFAPPFPSSTLSYPCICTRGLAVGWEALVFSSFGNISGQPSASSQQQELLWQRLHPALPRSAPALGQKGTRTRWHTQNRSFSAVSQRKRFCFLLSVKAAQQPPVQILWDAQG